jgi:hypothetical protein
LNFIESVTSSAATDDVRSEFSTFIEQVLARLREKGISDSDAHKAWESVKGTSADEEEYCRLIGSLGLSPYVSYPEIDDVLNDIAGKISNSMLTDLCEATSIANFNRAAQITDSISRALALSTPVHLHDLLEVPKPSDTTARAYEWGYRATEYARTALGIAHDDPLGSRAFFERLQFDPNLGIEAGAEGTSILPVSGAVAREDDDMRLSVIGANPAHRKFAAARASFLTWSNAKASSRLVTTARTRDQQGSRAFAAELLAPAKYLRKRLGDRTEVSPFTLDRISEEMGISPTVVRHQATNHGYYISEAA